MDNHDETKVGPNQRITELEAEREQMEKNLQESDTRFRTLLDATFEGVSFTEQGVIVDANQQFADILGYKVDELLGLEVSSLIVPKDRTLVQSRILAGSEESYEQHVLHKDGSVISVEVRPRVMSIEGRTLRVTAIRDITERKQADQVLLESEKRFRSIAETAGDAIIIFDSNENVFFWNDMARMTFGYWVGETQGRLIESIVTGQFSTVFRETVEQVVSTGKSDLIGKPIEVIGIRRDGSEFPLELSLATWKTQMGIFFTAIARDITERKQAEEALRESHRHLEETLTELQETQERLVQQERLAAVGQLAAGIAHDFNNILASIVLYTQMSLRMPELPPQVRRRLKVISEQSDRAAGLVQQILDFGRRAIMERLPLILTPFLKETVHLLERTLPEHVQITLDCGPDEYAINADSKRIQQAIVNLALNASDAMPTGGQLDITVSRATAADRIRCVTCGQVMEGEWVHVTVADTGTGITPDVLPHIFEPFFTTRAPLGSGLGLAQVYGIVKQHDGHVDVETEVGRGTTFKLYWPLLAESHSEIQAPARLAVGTGEDVTLLVVEDDETVRKALVDVLEMLNYKVLQAANGKEALGIFKERGQEIPLVLSDWVMPLMGGIELVHELKQHRENIKVVMLTGHPLSKSTMASAPDCVVEWIRKPPNLDQLTEAVSRALAVESE